jgi:hypothetical protein
VGLTADRIRPPRSIDVRSMVNTRDFTEPHQIKRLKTAPEKNTGL